MAFPRAGAVGAGTSCVSAPRVISLAGLCSRGRGALQASFPDQDPPPRLRRSLERRDARSPGSGLAARSPRTQSGRPGPSEPFTPGRPRLGVRPQPSSHLAQCKASRLSPRHPPQSPASMAAASRHQAQVSTGFRPAAAQTLTRRSLAPGWKRWVVYGSRPFSSKAESGGVEGNHSQPRVLNSGQGL